MKLSRSPLAIAALVVAILPFALLAGGLTLTSATDVVIFAIACMGLNILVGHTGLVSFGHGAFFGLAGYAAALSQRHWFPGEIVIPSLVAVAAVAVFAWLAGFLILRRRGVYFSLLTLALSAMLFAIAFRWTAVTGGESGLGNVVRPAVLGVGLAGLCGVLLAPIVTIHPAMGSEILTAAFVVVVIGGLGSFWGVVAAALLVGVVRGLTSYFLPPASEASMYMLMVLVLLFRPRGLFGERILKFE